MVKFGKVLTFSCIMLIPAILLGQNSSSLHENSPFVPSNFNPGKKSSRNTGASKAQQKQQLEFQGVYQINGNWMFSILNKSTRQSEWVGLNDSTSSYRVSHFDPETNSLSFQFENTPLELTLRDRSNTSIPVILAKAAKPVRRVPVRRKVNPNLPKGPPTAPPRSAPKTPPPNFTPPPLPTSMIERRALARRTAIPSTGRSVNNNSLFTAPGSPQSAVPGGTPTGIPAAPTGRPPSAPPPGPPPGARPPRKN